MPVAVRIITDSTSYIDPQVRETLDIRVVSLYVFVSKQKA